MRASIDRSTARRGFAGRLPLVGGVALLVLTGFGAAPVLTGRTFPPMAALESARAGLEHARRAGGARWAPGAMEAAERARLDALIETRRQQVRFLLFRDFRRSEALLRTASERAETAARQANRQKERARHLAGQAVLRAEQEVSNAQELTVTVRLDPDRRSLLQRSRISLGEAGILLREGEFEAAAERAGRAASQAEEVRRAAAKQISRYADPAQIAEWQRWIDRTVAESRRSGGAALIVFKEKRLVTLYRAGTAVKSYRADLGYDAVGDKRMEGDLATPEGRYRVRKKKGPAESAYHRALLLDYPSVEDRRRFEAARRAGRVPAGATLGGLIEIHGEGGRGRDWTRGCIALSNADVDDLFDRVQVGTPVTIVGGDGRGGAVSALVERYGPFPEAGP